MALIPGKPAGSYFEFDQAAREGAVIVFKVREHLPERYMEKTKNTVYPVLADLVVLTGSQAKTVSRGEDLIGSGIAPNLRRYPIDSDVVCVMGFKPSKYDSSKSYIVADPQPADSEAYAVAMNAFEKTSGDPYSAAERAQNPTGSLAAAPVQSAPAAMPAAPWPVAQPEPVAAGANGSPAASAVW